ncbi:Endopolyphosphatase [Podila humilis]|nr:Endopolyphosphatase [Podila humilis]
MTTTTGTASVEGGYFGTPNSICDSPFPLVEGALNWINRHLHDELDFVVWTGDNARHDSDNAFPRTQKEIYALNKRIAGLFQRTFQQPDLSSSSQHHHHQQQQQQQQGQRRKIIPVVPSIGNNDIYPHNIMPRGGPENEMLKHFAQIWSEFIPIDQINTFRRGGYYASEVVPGKIIVLSLNTLYFYNPNSAVNGCDLKDEPGTEEMDWLEAELNRVRREGGGTKEETKMVVYLTGHVPPDRFSYSPSCYRRYTEIALSFQDVIVGHLFGHSNEDHFFLMNGRKIRGTDGDTDAGADAGADGGSGGSVEAAQAGFVRQRQLLSKPPSPQPGTTAVATATAMERNVKDDDENGSKNETLTEPPYSSKELGRLTYFADLWEQYASIPREAKLDSTQYAIALVGPSIIPTYNPTLRVFSYQLQDDVDIDADINAGEGHRESIIVNNNKKRNHGRQQDRFGFKKPRKPPGKTPQPPPRQQYPPSASPNQFGFPLEYTQYWCNLAKLNKKWEKEKAKEKEEQKDTHKDKKTMTMMARVEFEVEYTTRDDYGLDHLGTTEWLRLARQIVRDKVLKSTFMKRVVVQTGARW